MKVNTERKSLSFKFIFYGQNFWISGFPKSVYFRSNALLIKDQDEILV